LTLFTNWELPTLYSVTMLKLKLEKRFSLFYECTASMTCRVNLIISTRILLNVVFEMFRKLAAK
jgi:hypothetical protein